ncbi:MAG: protoporphyrinogen oxidase [Myxococcota bacterium]
MAEILIVGAGVSGLATAAFLDGEGHDITVLEANDAPGGNVRTEHVGGRTLDRAANGWLNSEPAMDRLLARTGLTDQQLPASDRRAPRWIFADGKMQAAPMSPLRLATTGLLSGWSKLRLLGEPFVGKASPEADETIADFVSRRLGSGFNARMVGPMVAGIYAARPDQISLQAAFPKMWQMEQEYGSLFIAALRRRRGGAPPGHLTTMKRGAGQLTGAIAEQLGDRLRCGVTVKAIERRRDDWQVHTADSVLRADAVVLACPAWAQAPIVRGLDRELADVLDSIPY